MCCEYDIVITSAKNMSLYLFHIKVLGIAEYYIVIILVKY